MDKISAINRHLEMKSELRHLNPPPFGHCVFALHSHESRCFVLDGTFKVLKQCTILTQPRIGKKKFLAEKFPLKKGKVKILKQGQD